MTRRSHLCFIALAMLALGWAQVFGLTRGYVCSCSGAVEITQFDHCHGHEGFGCHHDDEPLHHHDDHKDHEDSTTHEHTLLKESLDSSVLSFPQISHATVIITDLYEGVFSRVGTIQAQASYPCYGLDPSLKRRWPQVLTRTIALRV
jgi:hypothetical protein